MYYVLAQLKINCRRRICRCIFWIWSIWNASLIENL